MKRQELKTEILSRGGSMHTKEKRDVTIRVRSWTKDKLKDYGTSGNDNDDVIWILMQDSDELKKLREWLKEKGIKAPEWKREEAQND
jgi:hypothetical protein